MIISVEELKKCIDVKDVSDVQLQMKLDAIENGIRKHTNNNFQERRIRFVAPTDTSAVLCTNPLLRVGDTVQISESINDGLYLITAIDDGVITLDKPLYPVKDNLVTKIQYGADIRQGVINLMQWEIDMRDKVGIASETLSRHSVTYFSQDASNTLMGYPVALLGFLEPYYKARF